MPKHTSQYAFFCNLRVTTLLFLPPAFNVWVGQDMFPRPIREIVEMQLCSMLRKVLLLFISTSLGSWLPPCTCRVGLLWIWPPPLYSPSRLNVKPSFCPFWPFNNHFGKLAFPSVLLDLAVWKFGISLVLAGLAATDFNGGWIQVFRRSISVNFPMTYFFP